MKDHSRETMISDSWEFRRGDIYLVNLNPFIGSEQGGTRPCVLVQNNLGNRFAPTLIVLPITSRTEKRCKATHYLLRNQKGLRRDSLVEAEQPHTIDKSRIQFYLGHIDRKSMRQIEIRMMIALGMAFLKTGHLLPSAEAAADDIKVLN